MTKQKMKCPHCGNLMNHHADKVFHARDTDSPTEMAFGGAVVEMHSCPACGAAATRAGN